MGKTYYVALAMEKNLPVYIRPPRYVCGEYVTPDKRSFPVRETRARITHVDWKSYGITVTTDEGETGLVWPCQVHIARRVKIQKEQRLVEMLSHYDFREERYQDEDPRWLSDFAQGSLLEVVA